MNQPGIGYSTTRGAIIHPVDCTCDLCREHRELTAALKLAEERGYYVGPAVLLDLAQIERELCEAA